MANVSTRGGSATKMSDLAKAKLTCCTTGIDSYLRSAQKAAPAHISPAAGGKENLNPQFSVKIKRWKLTGLWRTKALLWLTWSQKKITKKHHKPDQGGRNRGQRSSSVQVQKCRLLPAAVTWLKPLRMGAARLPPPSTCWRISRASQWRPPNLQVCLNF